MSGLLHPEVINGAIQWVDSGMQRVCDKIQHGCDVLGWEGDERLAVYRQPTPMGDVHILYRLEEDAQYRRVVATQPGDPFDDTIITWLCENDLRRNPDRDLHAEINAHNEARDAQREADRIEWVREDVGPRLHHAMKKDAGW